MLSSCLLKQTSKCDLNTSGGWAFMQKQLVETPWSQVTIYVVAASKVFKRQCKQTLLTECWWKSLLWKRCANVSPREKEAVGAKNNLHFIRAFLNVFEGKGELLNLLGKGRERNRKSFGCLEAFTVVVYLILLLMTMKNQ